MVNSFDVVLYFGDIKNGSSFCVEEVYILMVDIFYVVNVFMFFIFGDNEWNDCVDLDEVWGYWWEYIY